VIGVALDMDNGKIWFSKNGVFQASGDPVAGTNAAFTNLGGNLVGPWMADDASNESKNFNMNFGQRAFSYTAPSGFKCLVSTNLPVTNGIGASASTQASDYFNVVTYTGTGAVRSVTGVGFPPDFVWIKGRSQATAHGLFDIVRGATKVISTNNNAQQVTDANSLTSFNSDGFSLGTDASNLFVNVNTQTYVAWNWNAGGSNATNTAGTRTSTVRANTTSGFSVVSFNAGSAGNQTVGHGLGAPLSFWAVKSLSTASNSWSVGSSALTTPASNYLVFNSTAGSTSDTQIWANAAPTSTVFSFESGYTLPANADCIGYCFIPVAGFSAFGRYTGNGATVGPFVYTGFRPRFVLTKGVATSNWAIIDTSTSPYNVAPNLLVPNTAGAETVFSSLDILSNGFQIRNTDSAFNTNGGTYIYAAFADFPFRYSRAR